MQELGDKLRDVEFNMNEIDIQLKEEKENSKKLAAANLNAEKSRDALREELEKKKNEIEAVEKVKEKVRSRLSRVLLKLADLCYSL